MAKEEFITLVTGEKVPKRCVDALENLESYWPGATFPRARAAIVWAVLKAYNKDAS